MKIDSQISSSIPFRFILILFDLLKTLFRDDRIFLQCMGNPNCSLGIYVFDKNDDINNIISKLAINSDKMVKTNQLPRKRLQFMYF